MAVFNYANNSANQRTAITNVDSSRWVYQYDNLGQVISGKKYWSDGTPVAGQQFEYAFDDIGNRKNTAAGGDSSGAGLRPANYAVNALNQYTSREVPGYVNVIGTASNSATVSLWGDNGAFSATSRKGDYFRGELAVTNTANPVWLTITNLGVLNNGSNPDIVTNTIGRTFVAKTAEVFGYDLDGSLTNDGRWVYTWDAENRLTKVESLTSAPTASKRKVVWEFDGRGRRMRQTTYDGSSGSYVTTEDLKFVADGWRQVAELNATNNALVRAYVWGLDLSGSLDGAGGVGGLLMLNSVANGAHFYGYDGNGNVAALVNATDGSASANYEYDPFGGVLRSTGLMADENRFQFSTKRCDRTTDFKLYEYRVRHFAWLSRDPIEEADAPNLYNFVANSAINIIDVLGLYKPHVHKQITEAAVIDSLRQHPSLPAYSKGCIKYIKDLLVAAANIQDQAFLLENRRHYNRDLILMGETQLDKEKADQAYGTYILGEELDFFSSLSEGGGLACDKGLVRLGLLTHSWEDFFAHAIRRDGLGGNENSAFPGWVAFSVGVRGNPTDRHNFWPSSYSMFASGAEHPRVSEPLITGSPEYQARYNAAIDYVASKYDEYLQYWFGKCFCFCQRQ